MSTNSAIHPFRFRAILAAVILTGATACDKSSSGSGSGAVYEAKAADLVGTWKADFDASWPLSKAGFLKDTLRGSDAYSKDPAEKEAQVKEEMQKMLGGMSLIYSVDGKMQQKAQGETHDADYTVASTAGGILTVEEKTGSRKQTSTITFTSKDSMQWQPEGSAKVTIVFRRQ